MKRYIVLFVSFLLTLTMSAQSHVTLADSLQGDFTIFKTKIVDTASHLGNVREVVGNNGAVEQVTHYYPFGNVFCDGSSTNYDVQPYKYNGKEMDLIHGLNSYDYGARQLTMGIPRWDRVDPLAENTPADSPYAYCGNNPVNFFDSDGQSGLSKFAKVVVKISAKVVKKGPAALK